MAFLPRTDLNGGRRWGGGWAESSRQSGLSVLPGRETSPAVASLADPAVVECLCWAGRPTGTASAWQAVDTPPSTLGGRPVPEPNTLTNPGSLKHFVLRVGVADLAPLGLLVTMICFQLLFTGWTSTGRQYVPPVKFALSYSNMSLVIEVFWYFYQSLNIALYVGLVLAFNIIKYFRWLRICWVNKKYSYISSCLNM